MLTYEEVLSLNFYTKNHFTGWMKPLRFLIEKETSEDGTSIFHAWVWPGPYIFNAVDAKDKLDFTAPFSVEGQRQVVDWINQQYETYKDVWSSKIL